MSLSARVLLFTTNTELDYRISIGANEKFISAFVRLSEKQMPQGTTLVNPAADWRTVVQQRA